METMLKLDLAVGMLSLHVLSDVRRPSKSTMADVAGVEQFAGVGTRVALQSTQLCEPLATFVALERPFPGVTPHVYVEPRRCSELFLADDAPVHLLARVQAHVPLQVSQARELCTALFTDVRTFPGVPAHVVLQRTQPREPLLADKAGEGRFRVVGPQVDVQAAVVSKAFPADLARKRTLVCVQSHVCLQRTQAQCLQ